MQKPNLLEQPEYPNLPESENNLVGSISRDTIIWLAGIIDGEGSICVGERYQKRKNSLRIEVSIANTCPFMIRRVSEIYSGLNLRYYYICKRGKHWKEHYKDAIRIFVCSYGSLEKLLNAVYPFLVSKQDQALEVLNFIKWRKSVPYSVGYDEEKQNEIHQAYVSIKDKLRMLNKRSWCLQRLPRLASNPLDLSELKEKAVVESSPRSDVGLNQVVDLIQKTELQKSLHLKSTPVLECLEDENGTVNLGRHSEEILSDKNPECAGTSEYPSLPKSENKKVRKISKDNPDKGSLQRLPMGTL